MVGHLPSDRPWSIVRLPGLKPYELELRCAFSIIVKESMVDFVAPSPADRGVRRALAREAGGARREKQREEVAVGVVLVGR